jgi:hypothetical protein
MDRWIDGSFERSGVLDARVGRRREGRARDTTMSRALAKLFEPWVKSASTAYRATVGAELRKYGLRYDDLLDEGQDLDVGEALKRIVAGGAGHAGAAVEASDGSVDETHVFERGGTGEADAV